MVALSRMEAEQRLITLASGWQIDAAAKHIEKTFKFNDFHQTMAFVNALAEIAHKEDHHPDFDVSYGHCRVRYSTHVFDGLSVNDFICAALIDAIAAK
ncbi:4a-hydroxytetrahydrobiopterin dehydratase [Amphritea opalescens]|uniref:Putative pterin-4-alpha-carbinolamine dehydratase n=2 Tax=Amphritea opalescens TaxID=2490544 RepID=A0A430KVH0_9GAMM|nr:4a-hydroxytetrahydrobiopterin dehydratase [Amphritea opalescens]